MKTTKHTHKAFDGTTVVKGWVLEDGYGNKSWVYFNGVDICVHPASDWYDELTEVENDYKGMVHIDDIVETINKIDEPQKPVVPKFVADWVDNSREYSFDFDEWFDYENQPPKVFYWLNPENKRQAELNTLALVTLIVNGANAVDVEQEKLYTVEIPNPNIIGNERTVLMKNVYKQIVMIRVYEGTWRTSKGYRLTESEIRKDFEWAWQWAKEVE